VLGPKLCYLGLPKSGSTSLYEFIRSTRKGHEVDLESVISLAYRLKNTLDENLISSSLMLRYKTYKLEYDICTMFSLFPKSVTNAYDNARFISFIREPLDWAISYMSFAEHVRNKVVGKEESRYWDMVPRALNPSNYSGNAKLTMDWEMAFNAILNFWFESTVESEKAMEDKTSLIVKLSEIDEYLDSLKLFIGINNSMQYSNTLPLSNTASDNNIDKSFFDILELDFKERYLVRGHHALDYYKNMKTIRLLNF
jgi:hypothetical protein